MQDGKLQISNINILYVEGVTDFVCALPSQKNGLDTEKRLLYSLVSTHEFEKQNQGLC